MKVERSFRFLSNFLLIVFLPAYSCVLFNYFLLSEHFIKTQSANDTAAAEWSRVIFVTTKTSLKSAASLSKIKNKLN